MRGISARLYLLPLLMCLVFSDPTFALAGDDDEIVSREVTYRIQADNSGDVTMHERSRSLTGEGRRNISRIQIEYLPGFQEVEFKLVRTLKKDGSIVTGEPSSAFDTATPPANTQLPSFEDTRFKTILAPNVEIGDSVEYEAVLHIHKWLKPGDFWFEHFLATGVRVLSETVVLEVPADRKISFFENPAVPGKTEITNGRRVERWQTAKATDGATPLFAVSSLQSWDEVGGWIRSLNDATAEPAPEIAALAAKLTANKVTEQDRIDALYAYVATKVRYVSVSFGLGRLQPHAASTVLHNAYGDCKDQTTLLSALLRAAGFKAYAVLTTPGIGVRVSSVPSPDQFSHEFTAVDTKAGLLFLDTSMGPVSPGVLGLWVRGRSALLIREKNASLIDIPIQGPVPNRIGGTLKGKVTAAGAFEGSMRFDFQGIAEAGMRSQFADATDSEKETLLRPLKGLQFQNAPIGKISTGDPYDFRKPFWIQWEMSDNKFFPSWEPSKKVIAPAPVVAGAGLAGMGKSEKPFPMEPISMTIDIDLIVDPSLTIVNGMPIHSKSRFGTFDSEYSYRSGHLILALSFQLNGTTIAPSDWSAFTSFITSALTDQATNFTLERHSPSTSPAVARAMQQGAAAYQRRDFEASKLAYLEATRLDPQNRSEAWDNVGRAYAALHEYDEAEKAFKRQIAANPKDLYAYNSLGVMYRNMKRYPDAIEYFHKQIAVNPRDRYAHDNLGISFAALNRWEEARAESEIAVELTPDDVARRIRLGRAQVKTGHHSEAAENFKQALAQPHDSMAENNVAYYMTEGGMDLEKAWKLVAGALNSEAKLFCRPEALIVEPKCDAQLQRLAHMLDTSGWVLYQQGKIAESEPYLTSAFAISPHAETETHFATLLARLGRVEESLKCLADVASLARFAAADTREVRSELAKALGGESVLNSRLSQIQTDRLAQGTLTRILALVDESGRVIDARGLDPQVPRSITDAAKSFTLPAISWPDHSIRSIRTIELRQAGGKWLPERSWVGEPAESLVQ